MSWWRGAVIYQIYPRSFQDGNGDGVGDLAGITRRLDHIAALGVDGIWIAPFFPSPMKDFGYDVADYTGVDPLFGSLEDFDLLVARAHDLGLKVVIDQVWSHSSDQHPWFRDSRARGDKADWYVWADAKPDGTPPNNWLSVFGGPAWTWEPRRRQYYLHHFLPSQPALNPRHPAVLDALIAAGRFWLDRGVDGFRLDAVDFLLHDETLRDNPPRPPAGGVMPVKPFGLQEHRYDMAQAGVFGVMAHIRRLMEHYPGRTTIAEVSSEPDALARAGAYTAAGRDDGADGRYLHMAYTLRLMRGGLSAELLRAAIAEVERKFAGGWMCWAFSNHDVERAVSRWGDGSPACAKLLMALLLSLRGSICVYQGEELGLTEADIPEDRLQDPYGIAFWPDFKGRDGCRTPMPWQADAANGGFSAAEPWLPMPAGHLALAAERQAADPESVLNAWKDFLHWRKDHPALITGNLTLIDGGSDVVAFEREGGGERLLCVFNPGPRPADSIAGPLGPWGWRIMEGR